MLKNCNKRTPPRQVYRTCPQDKDHTRSVLTVLGTSHPHTAMAPLVPEIPWLYLTWCHVDWLPFFFLLSESSGILFKSQNRPTNFLSFKIRLKKVTNLGTFGTRFAGEGIGLVCPLRTVISFRTHVFHFIHLVWTVRLFLSDSDLNTAQLSWLEELNFQARSLKSRLRSNWWLFSDWVNSLIIMVRYRSRNACLVVFNTVVQVEELSGNRFVHKNHSSCGTWTANTIIYRTWNRANNKWVCDTVYTVLHRHVTVYTWQYARGGVKHLPEFGRREDSRSQVNKDRTD